MERTLIIILFCDTFLIFLCLFCFENLSLCVDWGNRLILNSDVKKNNDDKVENKIDRGDAYKMDIDNGITRIKVCVVIWDWKKKRHEAKRGLE